ncbi:hypothetical protein GQ457_05G026370 [Hibiscus cannabinus]
MLPILWLSMPFLVVFVVGCRHVYNEWLGCSKSSSVRCVVCLSKVSEREKLRSLPICHHSFHVHCIESWLKVRPNCPLCRINVAPHQNLIISSLLAVAKRLGKWTENQLCLELSSAVCESFGYI